MQGENPQVQSSIPRLETMDAGYLLHRFSRCLIHNLSNPLAAIMGCGQLLERVLQQGEKVDAAQCLSYVGLILSETAKCSRALDRLALLARPPAPRLACVDAHQLVQGALDSFSVPSGIQIALALEAWEPRVAADPEHMERVLADLLQNAVDAMPDGGTITIRTENCGDGWQWLRLTIGDEGPGIPADILPRLTEPFFSTRQRQNGIGLTLCAQLVHAQGGRLVVENGPQGGACATVELPVQQDGENVA